MSGVLSATDIVPDLYSNVEEEGLEVYDDLQYDLYNLAAMDHHPIELSAGAGEDIEQDLLDAASKNTQLLVRQIFLCPTERSEAGPLATLPHETSVLPREKHVPEPKPETKWEKYAREKGIKNHKKERMVFDEQTQMYVPRYGYKRKQNGIEEHAVVEVKAGQDPFADPWEAAAEDKKKKLKKVEKNQKMNIVRAMKKSGKSQSQTIQTYEPTTVPGIPVEMSGKGKRGKEGLRRVLQLAQHSTASMGVFDERLSGEPERKVLGKKRQFRDNLPSTDSDKVLMLIYIQYYLGN
jgi:regulator of ribosome biosynthesis